MDGYLELRTGGSPGARVDSANLEQAGSALVTAGHLDADDLDRVLALLGETGFTYASPMMFMVRGRRPAAVLFAPAGR